ncbi:hypothetical protein, partial [Mesorhizobium sp. M8A.F.Ca.ET.197.01.1.1]|uniref:hypothetical protein n=1 Tax=Mesorhizobium sp. M8A.F.Ca.ET.197.01.1.1 TaxID=2563965 RepID=UPI001AEDFEE8
KNGGDYAEYRQNAFTLAGIPQERLRRHTPADALQENRVKYDGRAERAVCLHLVRATKAKSILSVAYGEQTNHLIARDITICELLQAGGKP